MTDKKDDGGSAFPSENSHQSGNTLWHHEGMSLRDYFATHSTQPGISELVKAAGLFYELQTAYVKDGDRRWTFSRWWEEKTLAEQSNLVAKVRYAMADAMLKERTK